MCSCQRTRPVLFTRGCNPGQVFPANSYVQVALSPVFSIQSRSPPSLGASARHFFACCEKMVGVNGVEPLTPRLSSACSNQLSYTPNESSERASVEASERELQGNAPALLRSDASTELVELRRFELLTYSLQSYRSTN